MSYTRMCWNTSRVLLGDVNSSAVLSQALAPCGGSGSIADTGLCLATRSRGRWRIRRMCDLFEGVADHLRGVILLSQKVQVRLCGDAIAATLLRVRKRENLASDSRAQDSPELR